MPLRPATALFACGTPSREWCGAQEGGPARVGKKGSNPFLSYNNPFSRFERIATLSEHAHAVWTCDFHYSGDFLVSGAMDNTLKVWDLNTLRCRQTMRGHTDSVNCVRFQVG